MYPEAKKMVLRYQKIKAGIEDLQGLKTGHLMVGASTTPGEYLMPLLIGGFCKQYPGINVTLRVAGSEQVLRWLKEREIDIGITGVITSGNWVSCEPWIADELFLIACPGHPWTVKGTAGPGELTREPFILREAGSGTRRSFEQKLIEIGLEPGKINTVMELGSTRAVITAVQAGLGVGVVSGWAARDSLELGSVSRITLPFDMRRHLYLVWAKNNLDGPLAGEFQKFIGDPGNYGPFV